MRKAIYIAIASLLALALSGCFISLDNGAGSVGITLPPPRAISEVAPADVGRIYVINASASLPLDDQGSEYVEFEFPEEGSLEAYTVGPVPAGDGYQVILVFGNYETGVTGEEIFVPSLYAMSDPLTVYAGQATETDELTLSATPFSQVGNTLGLDLVGIVFDGTNVYVATPSTLYVSSTGAPDDQGAISFATTVNIPGGATANSITLGASDELNGPTAWINTSSGLAVYESGVLETGQDVGSQLETTEILDSGAFFIGTTLYGYVQFDGGLSAVRELNDSAPEWMAPTDLSEVVVGQPVYDLAVQGTGTEVYGYFATKLGAFRMPDAVIDDPAIDTAQEVFEASDFFNVSINGVPATITEIAIDPLGGTTLYLGTPRGAVRVTDIAGLGAVDNAPLSGTLIPGTAGYIVEEIGLNGLYVAVLTNQSLVYSSDGGSTFTTKPLGAASSGEVTGMLLDSSGVVLLATEAGLVGIDIN